MSFATLPPILERAVSMFGYDEISFWIVITAVFVNVSCALLGCFLVLRRMSLLGDAISHAILPGLVLGFIITVALRPDIDASSHVRAHVPMPYFAIMIGALIAGLLTALLTEVVHRFAKVPEDAAMGVVFTSLFALGVILIHRLAKNVDLDPGCVLYGMLETAALDSVEIFGYEFSRPAVNMGAVCLGVILFVALLWKELKIVSFDPQLATAQGINAQFVHYLLMSMVALVTVAAFEAVGSILVVAMLIAPAAMASMLTDRLGYMVLIAAAGGVIAAVFGREFAHGDSASAHTACAILSFVASVFGSLYQSITHFSPRWEWTRVTYARTSVSGMGAVVAGGLFTLAVIFSPSQGLIAKWLRQWRLTLRIVREDVLAMLYRWSEISPDKALARTQALTALGGGVLPTLALWSLLRQGRVKRVSSAEVGEGLALTDAGITKAQTLVKSHRLWEAYLQQVTALPADHLHAPADRAEHFITETILKEVADEVHNPQTDPHGRPIPRREGAPIDPGEKD